MNYCRLLISIITIALLFAGVDNVFAQSAKDYYKIAENFAKEENYGEAVKRYTKSIKVNPEYERSFVGRAKAYDQLGQWQEAAKDWEQAGDISGKDADYYVRAADDYMKTENLKKAEEVLIKAGNVDSKNMEMLQLKAQLYLQTGQFVEAHRSATSAMNQKRTLINTYWMGVVSDSLGNYEEAAAAFREILDGNHLFEKAYPGLVSVELKRYHRLTSDYMKAEELKRATEDCNKGLQLFPENAQLYVLRGEINFLNNDYSRAIDDISKAISRKPGQIDMHMKRGKYYREFGQHQNAMNDYNAVLSLDENSIAAYYQRGIAYESLFDYNAALSDFEEALRLCVEKECTIEKEVRDARNRILEMNRESEIPVIVLNHPVVGDDGLIKVPSDTDTLIVNGVVKDQSRIKYITINGINAKFNRKDNHPEFTLALAVDGIHNLHITTSDWYDNTTSVGFDILYSETDPPRISLKKPVVSDDGLLVVDDGTTVLAIEGQVNDDSPIRSLLINGVSASYRMDKINPTFTASINILNKSELKVVAVDIHGNESEVVYKIVREGNDNSANPMGKTWVVFIENSDYNSLARIDGPAHDINTMKQALAGYNINRILHKKDMSKNDMERFFSIDLRDLVRNNNVNSLLVWYAGHGTYLNDIAYWIPVDARRDDEFSYFNINNLKAGMQSYSQYLSHTLIVTDACDAGPSFADVTRSDMRIRSCNDWETTQLRSSQVLSASGYQQAAGQSPLTQNFAQLLLQESDGCMPVEKVVLRMSSESNIPRSSIPRLGVISGMGDENGTFFFIRE